MMRELRAQLAPTTDGTVRGYAALFDSWSLPITERGRTFRERIKPGALQPDGNVSLWWMHDHTDPLANTRGGSLTITEDAKGIAFVADLGTSPRADEIRDLIRRGVVDQMSIGFVALADIWDGNTSRTITKATLHEVSLVESAAYPGTSATVRNHQRKPAMSVKEDRARIAELNAEYNTATDERQFAIMDEVTASLALRLHSPTAPPHRWQSRLRHRSPLFVASRLQSATSSASGSALASDRTGPSV